MKKVNHDMYKAEARKVSITKTKNSLLTTSEKIGDISSWGEVGTVIHRVAANSEIPVDFTLWHTGTHSGITISSKQDKIVLMNQCDFEIVKNLFIRDLMLENVERLTIVKNNQLLKAKYKVNGNNKIKNYIYEPCDVNNLSAFLTSVVDICLPNDKKSIINGGVAEISNRGLKSSKGFAKAKNNRIRVYRNIMR